MNKALPLLFLFTTAMAQVGAIRINPIVTVYSHDIGLVLLGLYALFHIPKKMPRPLLLSPIIAFVGICGFSLLVNVYRFPIPDMVSSALYAFRWAGYALLYILVLMWPVRPIFWLWGLYGAGSLVAVLGLVQYVLYPALRNLQYLGWDPHLYRVFSTLLDPNFASMLFVLTLVLGIYLWRETAYKWIVGVGGVVTLIALFLTYSRSGYLALFVAMAVAVWFYKHVRLALIVMVLFIGVLFVLPKPSGEGVQLLRTASTFARIGNWQRGMTLISEQPLFGYGFNTLRYVQRARGWTDGSEHISHAAAGLDSSLQFVWATTGVLGFGAYVWLLASAVSLGVKAKRSKRFMTAGFVVVASVASIAVHSQFSNSLFYPILMIWWWVLLGSAERLVSSDT